MRGPTDTNFSKTRSRQERTVSGTRGRSAPIEQFCVITFWAYQLCLNIPKLPEHTALRRLASARSNHGVGVERRGDPRRGQGPGHVCYCGRGLAVCDCCCQGQRRGSCSPLICRNTPNATALLVTDSFQWCCTAETTPRDNAVPMRVQAGDLNGAVEKLLVLEKKMRLVRLSTAVSINSTLVLKLAELCPREECAADVILRLVLARL